MSKSTDQIRDLVDAITFGSATHVGNKCYVFVKVDSGNSLNRRSASFSSSLCRAYLCFEWALRTQDIMITLNTFTTSLDQKFPIVESTIFYLPDYSEEKDKGVEIIRRELLNWVSVMTLI